MKSFCLVVLGLFCVGYFVKVGAIVAGGNNMWEQGDDIQNSKMVSISNYYCNILSAILTKLALISSFG